MRYVLLAVLVLLAFFSLDALANVLPNYATGGNFDSQVQAKGKSITDAVVTVVGIASVLAIVASGLFFSVFANPDRGKQLMFGGVGGLLVASMAFGIARIVAS